MATSKKYFNDHYILLLLSIMAFLAVAGSIYLLLSLASHHTNGYIVQCRDCSNPAAINRFANGSVTQLLSFIGFAIIVFVTNFVLSMRTYRIHRQLALGVLSLGVLLMVLNVIVSGALLGLR